MMKNKYTQALKGKAGTLLVLTISLLSFQVHSSDLSSDEYESTRGKPIRYHATTAMRDGSTVEFLEATKRLRQRIEVENAQIDRGFSLFQQALKELFVEGELKRATKESLFEYLFSCFGISSRD